MPGVESILPGLGAFFAPDGSLVTTVDEDVGDDPGEPETTTRAVLRWDMDGASWRAHACAIAGRSLTPEGVGHLPGRRALPGDLPGGDDLGVMSTRP